MKRYFNDQKYLKLKEDFLFLFEIIRSSSGELDIKLRDNYFNLYYRGNSLAKIAFKGEGYQITIHQKFLREAKSEGWIFDNDPRLCDLKKASGDYCVFSIDKALLHPFFQTKYLKKIYGNIRNVNYSEELTFEQMVITDNLNREEMFIIDRQVTETSLKGRRMDLLALKQISKGENNYSFLLVEIKTGKNPELKKDAGSQLSAYLKHINSHFNEWKFSYEKNYEQIKGLNIFDNPKFQKINIVNDTKGLILVFGYSGIAKQQLFELSKSYPGLAYKQIMSEL